MKLFYSAKDAVQPLAGESFEKLKDIAAESKAEYELEKINEKKAKAKQ
ncbi:MAG: hypothetical protein HQL09_02520 [Nitrospirae bacterium]|nr:hypothetical protein [Nitrospirota bacterium]